MLITGNITNYGCTTERSSHDERWRTEIKMTISWRTVVTVMFVFCQQLLYIIRFVRTATYPVSSMIVCRKWEAISQSRPWALRRQLSHAGHNLWQVKIICDLLDYSSLQDNLVVVYQTSNKADHSFQKNFCYHWFVWHWLGSFPSWTPGSHRTVISRFPNSLD